MELPQFSNGNEQWKLILYILVIGIVGAYHGHRSGAYYLAYAKVLRPDTNTINTGTDSSPTVFVGAVFGAIFGVILFSALFSYEIAVVSFKWRIIYGAITGFIGLIYLSFL